VKQIVGLLMAAAVAVFPASAFAGVQENRVNALAFYDALIISKKGAAVAGSYLSPEFRSHSAGFADGSAKTFLGPAEEAFKNASSAIARWKIEVLRTIAEKDLVVIHARGNADEKTYAIVDIMRFDQRGKIVEHWDFVQDVTKSTNTSGAF